MIFIALSPSSARQDHRASGRACTRAESLEEADGIKALNESVANKAAFEYGQNALAGVTKEQPPKPKFVAGAILPTSRSLSVSGSVEDCYCSFKDVTWDEFVDSHKQQSWGLVDGGRDLLLQTIFDTELEGCRFCCGRVVPLQRQASWLSC